MNKAEEYIKEHTRQCSNTFWDKNDGEYNCSWLTPDQARKAVEIAREEIYEWLLANADDYCFCARNFEARRCIDDLKQAMKDEIWLEKQGEQKPVVIPKFRIGDIIKDTEDGEVFTIRTITKDKYIYILMIALIGLKTKTNMNL